MKLRDIMTDQVVRIHPEETVDVAARTLAQYNIGALPVCGNDGKVCGVVTDRDLVTRCLAAGQAPEKTKVRQVMTGRVVSGAPDMEVSDAARLMGAQQIRRLPVVEEGVLCGMVSLGDLATREKTAHDAAGALENISEKIRKF